MKDILIEKCVNRFIENQNSYASPKTKDIYSKKEYYKLLEPAINIIDNSSDFKIEYCREKLLIESEIENKVKDFVLNQGKVPGMVITFGTKLYNKTICVGNKEEAYSDGTNILYKKEPMCKDSIFDLASISKLFTALMIMKLVEKNKISLNDYISKLDKRFVNIGDVLIEDLLSFRIILSTSKRLEECKNFQEMEEVLFNINAKKPAKNDKLYTDMNAIVLKYIVESIMKEPFFETIKKHILEPLNMYDTFIEIPEQNMTRVVSNNLERRIINKKYILYDKIYKGIVNDPKARILNINKKQFFGHAGLFSTVYDIIKFCNSFFNNKILSEYWINEIGINRTVDFSQAFGYLCYSKNAIAIKSEVFHPLSGNTIGHSRIYRKSDYN